MIKLIILDVDGCLTNGGLIYSADAIESKIFNVKDGLGISTWIKMGNQVAIITGRNSKIVQRRAEELGIQHIHQGIRDKDRVLKEIVSSLGLSFYEVGAIGDDLNDYNMLSLVGKSFTPNDGVKEIKEIVNKVLTRNGGDGAVREMIDTLVDENDQREEFMAVWI
ncbi:3-deoxy-D-manno-octulosonate 8-phosphate phosphatase (KDO 8-P phosphatase) [Sulfurimonas gotlandica GD1]|uniref:3-deoxy-D-manno-octulosonate 8-phosphate phosphatase KdsC n=1 Tax=Sulfurimonas gotlandica (strain DSM 19862 / JCM 16533 / GD1) TaxID=929558 RepID=B6BJH4_SULGG|nr:HAD hydrolase family protein [Sulfurimonas gotlandica]EDZ62606.1 3-deoxy-D-manno-octulosonate 8-phosphate phosphatase [Sulfurimonas gotlandica GD1]EHP31220.1 3-deoxy-D-manno-octulosonate 8-phosphate phosphatase (KDO 8-P phosphatase) [Sulfurimonas gotlandica GD1]